MHSIRDVRETREETKSVYHHFYPNKYGGEDEDESDDEI
jgi:hypothetical protein